MLLSLGGLQSVINNNLIIEWIFHAKNGTNYGIEAVYYPITVTPLCIAATCQTAQANFTNSGTATTRGVCGLAVPICNITSTGFSVSKESEASYLVIGY